MGEDKGGGENLITPHLNPLPQGGCVITPVLLAIMQKYGKKIIEK
jgi:hypothetical protein